MKRKHAYKFAQHGGTARCIAFAALRIMISFVMFALFCGSTVAAFALDSSRLQFAAGLTTGYSPTSENQAQLPQSTVKHYDKNFVKNLKAETPFVRCSNRRELPLQSGNQHVLFMYNTLAGNINNVGEGTVGSGIQVSVVSNTSTIGQLADYVNVSDLALATAIDPALENIQKEIAYRLAQSLSIIVRNTADGASAIDASVNIQKPVNSPFGKVDITTAIQSLRGRDVMPFDLGRNKFCGVIHSFVVGDATNDNSNNSITDILKHTVEGQMKLQELPQGMDGEEIMVLDWAGAAFYESSLVTKTTNYLGSGLTALRTYVFGENGVISISLGKKEGSTAIGDGDWRNLQTWIKKADEPTAADPSRVIGGWTSYNVKFTAALTPDTTMRNRTVDSVSAIS
jgi:hypothetical protein